MSDPMAGHGGGSGRYAPVAIVTGAASGIGRHWAHVLRGRGFRLALADVNGAGLRAAFDDEASVRLHTLDTRSVEGWQKMVDDTLQHFGAIDYLFNIAGSGRPGFLLDVPMDLVDTSIDVNLKGHIYGMKTVAPVMVRQGSGHIVNMSSLAGISPTPGNELYSAAKSGLRAVSIATAIRLRPTGVFITVVCPDLVDTPTLAKHLRLDPNDVALIHSGRRALTVGEVEAALLRALRDRPLEITLPGSRGWFVKILNLFPPLMFHLYGRLMRRGLRRLELLKRAAVGLTVLTLGATGAASAQEAERVNLYRFVLDLEVPESPALVALGLAPTHALAATAPKPFGMSVAAEWDKAGGSFPAAAFEFSPYLLAGGGRRTLQRYRSNAIAGRFGRIGTKTVVSLGVADDPEQIGAVRVALGVRATLHDPHDPINNAGGLPEMVSALLPEGVSARASDVRGYSDAVDQSLTDAARTMRARPRWIVSTGYGVAGSLRDQTLERGNIASASHTFWLAWQRTLGENFDLLFTQALRGSRSGTDFRIASGLRRKAAAVDLLGDVYYDTLDRGLHGGVALSVHLARGIRAVLSLGSEPEADGTGSVRKLRVRSLLRWSSGS